MTKQRYLIGARILTQPQLAAVEIYIRYPPGNDNALKPLAYELAEQMHVNPERSSEIPTIEAKVKESV